jgi:acyl carrier protein
MKSAEDRIREILLDTFKVRQGAITAGTTFADLGFDSLVIVELSLIMDNEFGIALEDGDLTDVMTVGDAAELVTVKGTR